MIGDPIKLTCFRNRGLIDIEFKLEKPPYDNRSLNVSYPNSLTISNSPLFLKYAMEGSFTPLNKVFLTVVY